MPSQGSTEGQRIYDANSDFVGYTREQQILQELKRVLSSSSYNNNNNNNSSSGVMESNVESFLMRYLTAAHFSVSETVVMLKQRRAYEESLPAIRITGAVLEILRSGVLSIIGKDILGRPVLYINTQKFIQPALNEEDMLRLITVVMEYLLSYCSQISSSTTTTTTGEKTVNNTSSNSQLQQYQQIIILVNEEKSSWHANQCILTNISSFCTVISKYYPRLIGLVLLFEASWDVRQGMKQVLSEQTPEAKRIIQMVTRSDISKYLDRAVLPRDIGGYNNNNNNNNIEGSATFADAVLRHWYLKTSYLLAEERNSRPLWQLPPSITSVSEIIAMQRRGANITTTTNNNNNNTLITNNNYNRGSPPLAPPLLSRRGSGVLLYLGGDSPSFNSSRRSHTFRVDSEEDEGLCSALSEPDEIIRTTTSSSRFTPKDIQLLVDSGNNNNNNNNISGIPAQTIITRELQKERELRINAEQQLRKLRLGITLDLSTATKLERALASMHAELNVLIGNIIIRAREANASGAPPTLVQLLDLTLSALERAAHRAERVPAMKFASPARQGTPRNSTCCSFM